MKIAGFLAACLGLALTGCGGGNASKHDGPRKLEVSKTHTGGYPIRVVCTTGMIADLVRNVGGERLEVDQLLGPEIDPHTYKPTTNDRSRINQAQLVFYNGLHLEGKMGELFERMSATVPTFPLAEYLDRKAILEDEEKAHDPHVWFDVSLWRDVAGLVADVLSRYDAKHADEYKSRASAYKDELAKLHDYAAKQIATILPKSQRVLITSHDAFQYFGRAYDIEVKGVQGISTDAEASVKDIADLVRFITERKIKAVFVETTVNQSNMKALLEGCRARGHEVVIGGELFSDAMGKAGTEEGAYIGMIKHNVDTVVRALK